MHPGLGNGLGGIARASVVPISGYSPQPLLLRICPAEFTPSLFSSLIAAREVRSSG
jgi:hypothetical protein